MGARLSQPRGPGGTGETSVPAYPGAPPSPKRPFPRTINSRTIVAPAAAFTMACLLFVYTRTSIRAAKENAQRHRKADGGDGLSLLNEHRRRHGMAQKLDEGGNTVSEVGRAVKEQWAGARKKEGEVGTGGTGRSEEEERLRSLRGIRKKSTHDEG
ncbi:hypothetical protein LTR27_009669 [Elasticomyces elasticus]|nr:hypothetical protein LTR27_009669 [Elasticomyces elasticus]